MQAFGFKWSDSIDCSKLPWESLENHLCIPHPSYMGDGKENQDNLPLDGIDDKNVGNDSVSKESRHTWNIVDKSHEAAYHNSVDDENSKIIKQTNADYKTKKNSINYPILNTKHLTNMMHDPAKGRKKHKSDVETLQSMYTKMILLFNVWLYLLHFMSFQFLNAMQFNHTNNFLTNNYKDIEKLKTKF